MIKLYNSDCLEVMDKLVEEGVKVDAIITDPPYIKMVSDKWDRKEANEATLFFNETILKSEKLLRYGGRLVLFGSNKTQQYIYTGIKNTNLMHRELITIDKGIQVVSGRNTKQYKMHPNCVEYINVNTKFSHPYTKNMLLKCKEKSKLTSKQINEALGVKSNGGGMWSIYTGNNICKQVPTKEKWNLFRKIFNSLPEYKSFEEIYNGTLGVYNILTGFNFRIKNRLHPTQKPIELMEYLIKTYTNEGDLVLDFTMGSGTTALACKNLNRRFIGIELIKKYFNVSKDRLSNTNVSLKY